MTIKALHRSLLHNLTNNPRSNTMHLNNLIMHDYMVNYMVRIVQSELDEDEFLQLEKLCREKNLSKKEAIQLAIKNWIQIHQPLPKEDPLFTFNTKEAETKTSARDIDKVVYNTKESKK